MHAQKVALGHTMNDQAETFLMRLLRGSGSVGLSAMSCKREVFIRPLLSIQRHEILEYLNLRGITWREDASNLDTQFLRNRLRQELIPSLQDRYNPKIVPLLAGTAAILREESEALRCWAAEVFDREAIVEGNRVIWEVDTLVSLPSGLQKRLIRLSFERMAPGDHSLSAQNVASIIDLLGRGQERKVCTDWTFPMFSGSSIVCARKPCRPLRPKASAMLFEFLDKLSCPRPALASKPDLNPRPRLSCIESLGAISQPAGIGSRILHSQLGTCRCILCAGRKFSQKSCGNVCRKKDSKTMQGLMAGCGLVRQESFASGTSLFAPIKAVQTQEQTLVVVEERSQGK